MFHDNSNITQTNLSVNQTFEIVDDIHDGLGAFVRLDYGDRFEHAVVLLSSNFDSMYDLLYAPGVFIENWRTRYNKTPIHDHLGSPSPEWYFTSPMTIIIEPIALPTPVNANRLLAMSQLYPKLAEVGTRWRSTTPEKFLHEVIGAVSPANLPAIWNFGVTHSPGRLPFVPQYLAEFAIATRTLTIRYFPRVPPDSMGRTLFPRHTRTFNGPVTPMTIDPVTNMATTFVHFDMHFPADLTANPIVSHTPHQVADYRARFAMDFINDPSFVNSLNFPKTFVSNAPFLAPRKANTLPDQTSPQDYPKVAKQIFRTLEPPGTPHQPRVLIDSVWPDPSVIPNPKPIHPTGTNKGGQIQTLSDDPIPVPPVCILLTSTSVSYTDSNGNLVVVEGPCTVSQDGQHILDVHGNPVESYILTEALLKAYSPPGGGGGTG